MQDIRSIKSNTHEHAGHMDEDSTDMIPEYVLEEGVTTSTQQLGTTRTATRVVVRPQESGAKGVDMAHARAKAFWKQNPDGLYLPALLGTEGVCGKIEKLMLEFDKDGSESLNQEEFMQAMKSAVKNLKKAKQLQFLIGLLVGLAALALAAVVGITFATVYLTKEYTASADGAIMNNGKPVQVGSTDLVTTEGKPPPTGALRRKLQGSTNSVLRSRHQESWGKFKGEKANATTPSATKPIATDMLRANNNAVSAERIMSMTRDELAELQMITLQLPGEGLVKVKVNGYSSHTDVDMQSNTTTAQLEFATSSKRRPRLIVSKTTVKKTGSSSYGVKFPRYGGNGTGKDLETFRRKALADRRGFGEDVVMFAIDKLGEFMDALGLSGFIQDLINAVTDVLAVVGNSLDIFIDWLPNDWDDVANSILRFVQDAFTNTALADLLPDLKAEIEKWVQMNPDGRFCFTPLGFSDTPGSYTWSSIDGVHNFQLIMPAEKNCGGVAWNEIEMDNARIRAFFDRLLRNNPIAQVIREVLHVLTDTIPNALVTWWSEWEGEFFDIVEDILGANARNKLQNLMPKINPSDISRRRVMRRELKHIVDEAKAEQPNDRPSPARRHLRDFLHHPNATGPLREAFDKVLEQVVHRRITATANEIYHIENLRRRAQEEAGGETAGGESEDLHRRRLFELPSSEDVKNMFWFKTIPIKFQFSSEFVYTLELPNFLFMRAGDLMRDIGIPKIRVSRYIPVTTMVSVEVTLELDIRAPYKFLAVNKDAAIEFRVMYEAEAIFDAATGAFAARVDTSRDKKTGVRMVRGMVSGHGQFGLAIYANLGVGVCVASFCLSGDGQMVWNSFTIGFDTVMASESTIRGGNALNNMIKTFDNVEMMIQPPNKFIAYTEENMKAAMECAKTAGSGFALAGVYVNLPWPAVKIMVKTPLTQVFGKDLPIGNLELFNWNWDKYDPAYVYSAIGSPTLAPRKMTFTQFLASTVAYGAAGLLVGPFKVAGLIFPAVGGAAHLVDSGIAEFAKTLTGVFPKFLDDLMPPSLLTFTTDVLCFPDILQAVFPQDALQFNVPFVVPPMYEGIVDSLFPPKRRNDNNSTTTRRALKDGDVMIFHERDSCLHHGEICSEHGQCCDPHAICGHVSYTAFRVCKTASDDDWQESRKVASSSSSSVKKASEEASSPPPLVKPMPPPPAVINLDFDE